MLKKALFIFLPVIVGFIALAGSNPILADEGIDFAITKTASTNVVHPGDTFHYHLTVEHVGTIPGYPQVYDTLPEGLEFVSAQVDSYHNYGYVYAAVNSDNATLHLRNIDDGSVAGTYTITSPGNTIHDVRGGIAVNPLTDVIYVGLMLDEGESIILATLDPQTWVATIVGDTGMLTSSLEFDSAGTLYTVDEFDTLYTLNLTTGAPTSFLDLSIPTSWRGAIEFNPDDGYMYHSTGSGEMNVDSFFRRINLSTKVITPITYTGGSDYRLLWAMLYNGSGTFYTNFLDTNISNYRAVMNLTTAGAGSAILYTVSTMVTGTAFINLPIDETCTEDEGVVSCMINAVMVPGSTADVVVTVRIPDDFAGSSITNVATVDTGEDIDPDLTDNEARNVLEVTPLPRLEDTGVGVANYVVLVVGGLAVFGGWRLLQRAKRKM